jgi:hypothetical protein
MTQKYQWRLSSLLRLMRMFGSRRACAGSLLLAEDGLPIVI